MVSFLLVMRIVDVDVSVYTSAAVHDVDSIYDL